jgi:hypothetical protein
MPAVSADTPDVPRTSDPLITDAAPACTERGWPYYNMGCRPQPSGSLIRPVRLVSTDRL